MIRIEYLNKEGKMRTIHHILKSLDDCEMVWIMIRELVEDKATDINIKY